MKVSLTDSILVSASLSSKGRDFADSLLSKKEKVFLDVAIRATHSGQLITGRCYTGWGMKGGTKTWFSKDNGGSAGYDKPIIVNHDMDSPPLGRIYKAEFTQLKFGKDWESDWQNPDSGAGNLGSGYITTHGYVYDSDCIEKIMDGRYKTVSSRQIANHAWCNICGIDFCSDSDDVCTHTPGQSYDVDGVMTPCYAVMGLLDYVELSWVNGPRQPNAISTSFKLMKSTISEGGDSFDIDFLNSYCDSETPLVIKIKSEEGEAVDLSSTDLPSTDKVTNKTTVSMTRQLKGFEEARKDVEDQDLEQPTDSNEESKSENSVKEKMDENKFALANLARLWKDSLDMEKDFADSSYMFGITEKASGHAHVFDAVLAKGVLSGSTYRTGQGKTDTPHTHYIWMEGVEFSEDVEGETRDASYGPSHIHDFMLNMEDSNKVYVTLIPSPSEINEALTDLDTRVNKDTLVSDDVEKLVKEDGKVKWDVSHFKAAVKLMRRLSDEKRYEIVGELFSYLEGVKSDTEETQETEESNMKALVDRIESLVKESTKLANEKTELSQLLDSKEAERKQLLDENVELKAALINMKAELIQKAKDALEGQKSEEERKTSLDSLLTKDESELDAMIVSVVLANVRKLEDKKVEKPVTSKVQEAVPSPAVPDSAETKKSDNSKKGLALLESRAKLS